jgi:hypothetical protein
MPVRLRQDRGYSLTSDCQCCIDAMCEYTSVLSITQLWHWAKAAGHPNDADRCAAGAIPLAEGGLLAVGRHLELLGGLDCHLLRGILSAAQSVRR